MWRNIQACIVSVDQIEAFGIFSREKWKHKFYELAMGLSDSIVGWEPVSEGDCRVYVILVRFVRFVRYASGI